MRRHLLKIFTMILLTFVSAAAGAQISGDSVSVSIVNVSPGSDIYELEGHTLLRVSRPIFGYDFAVSYGTFDFDSPNFAYRFVKGDAEYWMEIIPWDYIEYAYREEGRTLDEHRIAIDSVQGERLMQLLQQNALPENRSYRYNYVKDNCATRPVRILEQALGDTISFPAPVIEGADLSSFRKVMRYYHRNYPWYQFGIDLALGSGIDYPISGQEAVFAPVLLDVQLPGATIGGRPLVTSSSPIFIGADKMLPPTPWYLSPLFVCWLVFALAAWFTWRDVRRHKVTRWFDTLLFTLYGLIGLLLTFLIFVSVHEATSPNWQYLWLNPLCLAMPLLLWSCKGRRLLGGYCMLNIALIVVMCIVWPFTGQQANAAFIPLVLCDLMRSASYIYNNRKTR